MFVYTSLAGKDHLHSQISPLLTPLLASIGLGTAGAAQRNSHSMADVNYKNLGHQITQDLFALEKPIAN